VTGAVVVGTGFGCITHVRALRAAGCDVVALVGRDAEKTARRAAQFGVAGACTSLEEALARPGVDAVTIATPPHTHAALALTAIDAGKHVLCEKPFARDAAEALTVLEAAERAGIVHLLGTEFRFDRGQAMLARAVARGLVGTPRLATVVLHVPMLAAADAEVPSWWGDRDEGGGWLGAHGSQIIDQVRVTLGEFASVSASLLHMGATSTSADDTFVVHATMESGASVLLQSSAADRGPMLVDTRVAGTGGTAWIDGLGDAVWVSDRGGTRQLPVDADLPPSGRPEPLPAGVLHTTYDHMIAHGLDLVPYTRLAEVFRDRILGRDTPSSPPPATFHDGVAGMAVLDAIRTSAVEQRRVAVVATPRAARMSMEG
jgi:predicted dehydrogenase